MPTMPFDDPGGRPRWQLVDRSARPDGWHDLTLRSGATCRELVAVAAELPPSLLRLRIPMPCSPDTVPPRSRANAQIAEESSCARRASSGSSRPGSAVRGHTAEIADVKVQVAGLSTMEIGLATSEVW